MLLSLYRRLFPHLTSLSTSFDEARKREGFDAKPDDIRGYHPGLWPLLRKGWREPDRGIGGKYLPREKDFYAEVAS